MIFARLAAMGPSRRRRNHRQQPWTHCAADAACARRRGEWDGARSSC